MSEHRTTGSAAILPQAWCCSNRGLTSKRSMVRCGCRTLPDPPRAPVQDVPILKPKQPAVPPPPWLLPTLKPKQPAEPPPPWLLAKVLGAEQMPPAKAIQPKKVSQGRFLKRSVSAMRQKATGPVFKTKTAMLENFVDSPHFYQDCYRRLIPLLAFLWKRKGRGPRVDRQRDRHLRGKPPPTSPPRHSEQVQQAGKFDLATRRRSRSRKKRSRM